MCVRRVCAGIFPTLGYMEMRFYDNETLMFCYMKLFEVKVLNALGKNVLKECLEGKNVFESKEHFTRTNILITCLKYFEI